MTDYQTLGSGARQHYESGMHRDSQAGKPRFDLLLPAGVPYGDQMLTRWAALMARGGELYGDRNWEHARTADELERYKSSALRHMMQYLAGEMDEDHAAAVMFNVTAAEYVRTRMTVGVSHDTEDNETFEVLNLGYSVPVSPEIAEQITEDSSTPASSDASADYGSRDDGLSRYWVQCSGECDVQVARPGQVQCGCEDWAA